MDSCCYVISINATESQDPERAENIALIDNSSHKTDPLGKTLSWAKSSFTDISLPKADELHIWCLPLKLDAEQTELAISRLNHHQQDRYQRRVSTTLQETYLAGRYFLSELLGAYLQQDPNKLTLAYSRLNKPYLAENTCNLNFNFTDSCNEAGNLGVFAFALGKSVGIDIEALSRRSNFAPIAARKFSELELNWSTDKQGVLIPEKFLALWTRKEAYGKATGKGINFKMRELELLVPGAHHLSFVDQDNPHQPFQLQQFLISDSHVACVVHEGHEALRIKAFTNCEDLALDGQN